MKTAEERETDNKIGKRRRLNFTILAPRIRNPVLTRPIRETTRMMPAPLSTAGSESVWLETLQCWVV